MTQPAEYYILNAASNGIMQDYKESVHMLLRFSTVITLLLLLTPVALIAKTNSNNTPSNHFLMRIGLGAGVSHFNQQTQNIQLNTNLFNRYINDSTTNGSLEFNTGFGYLAAVNRQFTIEFTADAYLVDFGNSGGTVKPAANININFDTLNYAYTIQPTLLGMFETRFAWNVSTFQPYFLAGAGIAYVKMQHYYETTPAGSSASPMAFPFGNDSEANLAYTFGLGVQYHWHKTNWVELGYQYINADRAQLNVNGVQTSSTRLQSAILQGHYLTMDFGISV
ncbi:MAG: outer membrane beta-barrel protein [Coxiellaceae bacterium]|nr:outer membrane beta-barrel protein [Coxiellaceae bacterium]